MTKLGKRENRSLSDRLHDQLKTILSETPPGDRLPSEPQLAANLGVSRATLREAMRIFETQGRIHRRQGVGTFVVHPSHVIETGLEKLESIMTVAEGMGLSVQVGDYQIEVRPADEKELAALELPAGSNVLQIIWVIETSDRPVAYLVDILPEGILDVKDVEREFVGSVLDLMLARRDIQLSTSRTEISAVSAKPEVARALGIQRGDVVVYFEATLFDDSGQVVDYSYSYYLPGFFRFHVVRRVG